MEGKMQEEADKREACILKSGDWWTHENRRQAYQDALLRYKITNTIHPNKYYGGDVELAEKEKMMKYEHARKTVRLGLLPKVHPNDKPHRNRMPKM
jgi:hypothetical protein